MNPTAGMDSAAPNYPGSSSVPPPEEQRAVVKELLERDSQAAVGGKWYLLSQLWWRQWKAFVSYDAASAKISAPNSPGPLRNSDLLEPSGALKVGLSENVSFVLVPESVWARLKEWYGCEPGSEIERKVVKVGNRTFIEVYPWIINLSFKDAGMLVTMKITISQAAKIEDLEALAKQRLNIDEDDNITLWDTYGGQRGSLLPLTGQVGHSVLYNGCTVIVQRSTYSASAAAYDIDSDTEAKSTNGVADADNSDDEYASPPPYNRLQGTSSIRLGEDDDKEYYGSTSNSKVGATNGYPTATTTTTSSSSYSRHGVRGTVGLGNLGNTCFMNSSLQCLSNTVPLRNYFLSGEFYSEINAGNALGTKGELVQAFANLLRSMWNGSAGQVAPRVFKHTLGKHAEQFMGYDQHDSQELIAYLLDGIHEDVNRIEKKPYVEQVEAKEGESDESAADRAWDGHLQRNRSRIVDLFQGQFKSVVTCPVESCNRVSITFDPFMYLSVPLPFSQERKLSLVYVPLGGAAPRQLSVSVSKAASLKTMLKAMYVKLGAEVGADGLPAGLEFKIADTYQGDIYEVYELTTNLTDVPDNVDLHVFELPAKSEEQVTVPAGGDRSWVADFKRYLWAPHQFDASMQHPATELYTIENRLRSALELVGPLQKATDDYEVDMVARRSYTFDRIKTLEDRDRFLAAVEGFKDWVEWFKNDYGSDTLPVLLRGEVLKQVRDIYSIVNAYRTQKVVEALGVPLLVPYQQGVTTLSDVVDHVARACYRMIKDKSQGQDKDQDEQQEADVEAKIRRAREILASECITFVETKRRYATPERNYIRRPGDEDLTPEEIQTVLESPLAEWLSRGARLVLYFGEEATQNYVDLHEAKRIEEEEQEPLADKRRKNNDITLYDCISCFMQKEQLEETEMWYCNQCKEHRQAWKQFFLWRTPPILVIHLKRFQYDGMFRDKLDHLVDFPLEGLDLSQHVLDSRVEQPAIYDLYAVSNHYGGLGGGHYTAFCRNAEDGNWYEFDDSYVRQVEPNSVVTEAAYVLFYMRRDLFPQRLRSQAIAAVSDVQSPADSVASGEEGWVHIQQPAQNGGAQSAAADALDVPVDALLERGDRALEEFKASGGEVLDTYSTPTSSYKRSSNMYGNLYSAYL